MKPTDASLRLSYEVRYLRWRVREISRAHQARVPGLDSLLLGLLQLRTQAVTGALQAAGVSLPALETDAQARLQARPFQDYAQHFQEFRDLLEVASAEAGALGSDAIYSEHLLLALAAFPGSLSDLLDGHGIAPEPLREAVRQQAALAAEAHARDGGYRDRLIREAWHSAMAGDDQSSLQIPHGRHPAESYPVDAHRIRSAADELREAGDFSLLGALYEALGAANALFFRSGAIDTSFFAWSPSNQWVTAAHFYRLAGEREQAAALARRALSDLEAMLERLPPPDPERPTSHEPYFRELKADAAVCLDPGLAGALYDEALAAFDRLDARDPHAQDAEAAEPWGWGGFLSEQAAFFLPGDPRQTKDRAAPRIRLKRSHWLAHHPGIRTKP